MSFVSPLLATHHLSYHSLPLLDNLMQAIQGNLSESPFLVYSPLYLSNSCNYNVTMSGVGIVFFAKKDRVICDVFVELSMESTTKQVLTLLTQALHNIKRECLTG